MSCCDLEKLRQYFEKYGWVYRLGEDNECYSGWSNSYRSFPLKVKLNSTVMSFEVELVHLDTSLRKREDREINKFILDMNRLSLMIKLIRTDCGTVSLHSEVLAHGFGYQNFEQILGIVGHHAERLQEKILTKMNELESRRNAIKCLV